MPVGAIAQHIEVVDDLLAKTERFAVRHAERHVGGKNQNASVIVAEAELAGAAQHAVAADAKDRFRLDGAAVGHHRARCGQRDDVARLHVERTAPDVALDAVASVDVHAVHLRRVGVPFGAQHLGRDDTGTELPTCATSSTLRPRLVMTSAIASTSSPTGTRSFNHEWTIFIRTVPRIGCRCCTSRARR